MVKSTIIAWVVDGLPLAASMDDKESSNLTEYKTQAKNIFKRLSQDADTRCSIETGAYVFQLKIQKEFNKKYGNEVASVARPYAFVKFGDTFIQKTKKQYKDTRTQKNLNKLNDNLQDVTQIMTKNISDVLGRGETLDRMSTMLSQLKVQSQKYKKASKSLNMQALNQKYGPVAIVRGVVLLVLILRFWWW
ncbi:hypothetical protein BC830DRAFT_1162259 [Chytriomyces sp. MP71]|nr:hypothetical protein BC830DRAFT_1162259 [Chytriomyces sp. MP71]